MRLKLFPVIQYDVPVYGALRRRRHWHSLETLGAIRSRRHRRRYTGREELIALALKMMVGLILIGAALITGALRLIELDTKAPGELIQNIGQRPLADSQPEMPVREPAAGSPVADAKSLATAEAAAPGIAPPNAPAAIPAGPHAASVAEALQAWAKAWSRRDLRAYFDAYTPSFHGRATDRSAWEKDRYVKISLRQQIDVSLSDLQVEARDNLIVVRFIQSYASPSRSERAPKLVALIRASRGKWLICNELTGSELASLGERSPACQA